VKDQISKSSGTGDIWAALLVGDKIKDLATYHKLRYQRLDEQVGRSLTQERYRRNKTAANKGRDKNALVMRVEHIGNVNIQRDHTGLEGFDLLGGQEKKNPNNIGFCVGDLVLVGGEAGVGKTKLLLQAMGIAAGPFVNDTALYMQSEFDLETFKAKYCDGLIKGDEDLYISAANTMEDIIEAIYQTKPRWVVIDSKDKVQECRTSAGWERFQRRMREVARDVKCTIFIVTHLNQGGDIYGGGKIKHDVDVVMLLHRMNELANCFRASIETKNRGGIADDGAQRCCDVRTAENAEELRMLPTFGECIQRHRQLPRCCNISGIDRRVRECVMERR
jgi:predicted ATP-dependent serine protease